MYYTICKSSICNMRYTAMFLMPCEKLASSLQVAWQDDNLRAVFINILSDTIMSRL